MKYKSTQGFTLIEMSVVLLIIGTIVAAILLGRSLLVTSRLQTVITDADSYMTAVTNFKQTYQALPGDMINAASVWGIDSYGCPEGGGPTGTCSGNGDGKIKGSETFRFWQHLYDAKMFSQSVTGVSGDGIGSGPNAYGTEPGINVPAGPIRGSGFTAIWFGTITATSSGFCTASDCFDTTTAAGATAAAGLYYGNVLQFGASIVGSKTNITNAPILTPDQAAGIDTKIDDGIPATGKVRAYISTSTVNPGCTTSAAATTAAYNLQNAIPACSLIFVTGF